MQNEVKNANDAVTEQLSFICSKSADKSFHPPDIPALFFPQVGVSPLQPSLHKERYCALVFFNPTTYLP